jgi:hypothetical protein
MVGDDSGREMSGEKYLVGEGRVSFYVQCRLLVGFSEEEIVKGLEEQSFCKIRQKVHLYRDSGEAIFLFHQRKSIEYHWRLSWRYRVSSLDYAASEAEGSPRDSRGKACCYYAGDLWTTWSSTPPSPRRIRLVGCYQAMNPRLDRMPP